MAAYPPAPSGRVNATDHHEFWLWAGVAPQTVLSQARSLYVLQGQIAARPDQAEPAFIVQGFPLPSTYPADLWVVYRVHTLRWTPRVHRLMRAQLERWLSEGINIAGIQIDFDARTQHLDDYAAFLRDLRQRLPTHLKLGITGLMDWGGNADLESLNELKEVVDEVVIQTYQGRHTISNYSAYLPGINRLQLPFKIGLVQNGEWQAPAYLGTTPWFRGYVVFLQNQN
jgi:hypothetical protein